MRNGQKFFYPRNGYGQICERLAEEAQNKGAKFFFDTEIDSIDLSSPNHAITETKDEIFESKRIWSTAPFGSLAKMLSPSPPPEIIESLNQLNFYSLNNKSFIVVFI